MRMSPVPPVSTNVIPHVLDQAFMWLRIRPRSSAGVLSRKLTVNRRGFGPQYLVVSNVRWSGVSTSPVPERSSRSGALTGLIRAATSAAVARSRPGTALMWHTGSSYVLPLLLPIVGSSRRVVGDPQTSVWAPRRWLTDPNGTG